MRRTILLLILLLLTTLILPKNSFAQGAISVTPQIFFIDLSKDEPMAEFTYKNTTTKPIELSFTLRDFKELEEGGIPGFLDKQTEKNYKYGLSSWAKLSSQTTILEPNQKKTLQVSVDPTRLGLGGHYSSIMAEIIQPDNTKDVKLKAVLASLLFVRSGGEFDRTEGKILFLTPSSNFFLPESLSARFQNSGNVFVTPYGRVEISDFLGREVGSGIVNENSLVSLPESIRTYPIPLSYNTKLLLPGIYKASLKIHFGGKNLVEEKYFFSIGNAQILLVCGVVILSIALLLKHQRGRNKHQNVVE